MAGAGMQIAGNIFNEMVMQEAIKDRTEQYEKECCAQAEQAQVFDDKVEEAKDSDSDFNSEGDDGVLM